MYVNGDSSPKTVPLKLTDNIEESSPAHGDSPTEYEKMEELFKSISSGSVMENGCGRLSHPFASFKVA